MRRPTPVAYHLHLGSLHKGIFITSAACALLLSMLSYSPVYWLNLQQLSYAGIKYMDRAEGGGASPWHSALIMCKAYVFAFISCIKLKVGISL